jgi:hypothetical protein
VSTPPVRAVLRPFGAANRRRLLEEYFKAAGDVTVANAWQHVYRLLMWIDATTGLAHCYESDKAQPGRHWYARSLALHDWLAAELDVQPEALQDELDWLFKKGSEQLTAALVKKRTQWAANAADQRQPYEGRGFPQPGEDPVLEQVIQEELGPHLQGDPPPEVMRRLIQRIREVIGLENKRRNLLGEGFEDVLAFVIRRLPGAERLDVQTRPVLHSLPGFREPDEDEKARKVDLAIITPTGRRVLVTAKWSVRADREEQFGTDWEAYDRLNKSRPYFEFVWVTNEFDAARLAAACRRTRPGGDLFTSVVHMNPAAVLAAYGRELRRSAFNLPGLIDNGRLISLEQWLTTLTS